MIRRILVASGLVCAFTVAAAAAEAPAPELALLKASAPDGFRLNRPLDITIAHLDDAIAKQKRDPSKFTLYLAGYELPSIKPYRSSKDTLRFMLSREGSDSDAETKTTTRSWIALLGHTTGSMRPVRIEVRADDGKLIAREIHATFEIFQTWVAVFWIIFLLALLGLFVWAARTTNIIRDTVPPKPKNGKRPYSLARFQMAWWFLVIVASFIFIFAITGDWHTLNDEALILMGIGTGTALGATIIEITKQRPSLTELQTTKEKAQVDADQAQAKVTANPNDADARKDLIDKKAVVASADQQIADFDAAQSTPASVNIVDDLLTDAAGANVHRFQMLGWTMVLGIIYVYGVWSTLALPEFTAALNALLGISSGAYLGFKIPEKQN